MRAVLFLSFVLAVAWAQYQEAGAPEEVGRVEVVTEPRMPVRLYLFKDDRPFRLSPVDAMMPLRVDSFYRERLWTRSADPRTLEVTCLDASHFFLLKGSAEYALPAGSYRLESYRGHFYEPAAEEFFVRAGQTTKVVLRMKNWLGEEARQWLAGDDHIHLMRDRGDDATYLDWLAAEDLSVGNFLQLQRQADAAVQYGFGPEAEARRPGYSIRSGHESRSEFFGHVNLLGGNRMVRPLSTGTMYANTAHTWPHPALLFAEGRKLGALTGYAHFHGSMPNSTQLMDLALGNIDFLEVFQFGVLKTEAWYELLNAGLRITGIAGSDFPVYLNRFRQWPRYVPLLGPERALVRASGDGSAYQQWAAGIRKGEVTVTNGPFVAMTVEGGRIAAKAKFFRPLESLEIVANGAVIARAGGDGSTLRLAVSVAIPQGRPVWVAARAAGQRKESEPELQAHTNPVYFGEGVPVPAARERLAQQWERQANWYRTGPLNFPGTREREQFFAQADEALRVLRR
ncbi:MAG: CehA/McbA family metallohydrolase [Bryobacterales bacterium]|nr:CehA/McbA family metallohydrolase [Bryobacterales bacterium]